MLVTIRIPGVLHGRFWAEDGLFLLDALRLPWYEALVRPHTGYLDLVASTTMFLATRLVKLEYAPLVSLTAALAVQVLPVALLASSRIPWLRDPWRLAGTMLMLAAVPLSEEIWLSPVTSQYHLIVAVGIVLACDVSDDWTRWLHRMVLLIAPLAGPGPSLICPLFFLRTVTDRSWARAWQGVLISAGTLVQLGVLYTHPEPHRGIGITPDLLLLVVAVKQILVPLLGRTQSIDLSNQLSTAYFDGPFAPVPLLVAAATAIGLVVFGVGAWRSRNFEARWLYLAAVLTMVLSYIGSLGQKELLLGVLFGQRYFVAPHMLFSLTLVAVAAGASGLARKVANGLAVWLIVIGVSEYFMVDRLMASGPSWRAQIKSWQVEPRGPISLWPPSFVIELPKI